MHLPARANSRLLLIAALAVFGALVFCFGYAWALPISIGGCSPANSFTWTGEGDGHNWNDAKNWSPEEEAPPKEGDAATIQGNEAHEAEVEGASGSVCELTVEGSDAFLTSSNLTIEGDLNWEGGEKTKAASELEGSFTVAGEASLSHKLGLSQGTITSNGSLDVEGGTDLTLSDKSATLVANGLAEIGGGVGSVLGENASISSNGASEGDDNAKFEINSGLMLAGDVESPQLDLNLGPHALVDLDGNSWTLPGLSFSRWKGGSEVKSSSAGGIIDFTNLAQLLVDGSVGVGKDALLSMQGDSTLTDGRHAFTGEPAGAIGQLHGEGALEWQSGSFEGQLTLAPGFQTVLDSTGTHELVNEAGTLLRNEGSMDVQQGELLVDGEPARLENWGTMKVHAGAELDCNSSACGPGALDNTPEGKLEILAQQPAIPAPPPTTTVAMNQLSFLNNGDLEIGAGRTLLVQGDGRATLAEGGIFGGGGTLRLGEQGLAHVVGTTTLRNGSVLSIDGEGAELHAGTVNSEGQLFDGVLNAAQTGEGDLRWADGGIEGSLLTDNKLQTNVVAGERHYLDEESLDSQVPSRNPTSLTLASPTQIAAPVTIGSDQNGDAVSVDGPTTIAAPGGFTRNSSDDDGVIVDPTGSLSAQGAVAIEAPLSQLGRVAVPPSAVLRVPLGFSQTGSAATVLGGTLTSDDGQGNIGPIELDGGSLQGPGTIIGDVVNPGASVSPGAEDGTPGTLKIEGDYTQQLGGTLAVHVNGTGAAQHDTLAVSGTVSLSGALAALGGGGYQPAVPTMIAGVLTAPSVAGSFASSSSTGTPANTAWQPSYRPGAVDLNLISTGSNPPPKPPGFLKGKAAVKLAGGLHLLSKGRISFKVHNANAFPVVPLSVTLKAITPALKGSRASRAGKALTIGSAQLRGSIPALGTMTISVPLNATGRRLLQGHLPPKIEASVSFSAPDGSRAAMRAVGRLSGAG